MASTPSASALSAVLRCRGNIWTRNPPTKRPATSVYSLGLAGGVFRDSPAERTRSTQTSSWVAFLRGERVVVGRRQKESREINKLYNPKLSQSSGDDAHSAAPGVQNALVRQLARKLTFNLPKKCPQTMIQIIKYETSATHVRKIICVHEIRELQAGVLKVSITSPSRLESAGQIPSFVFSGWSALKSTCLSLTALVSGLMRLKLLRGSSGSSDDAQDEHLLSQQDENHIGSDALRANGHLTDVSTRDNSGFRQGITEDRPD